jgi:MSHA pilin protein MshA
MKKQNGFTLIELVIVIIILGILAVTAAPKFIDLQSDARESTLQGMKAALEGASTLAFSKAAIQGKERLATACVEVDSSDDCSATPPVGLTVAYGYPLATQATLQKVLGINMETASTPAPNAEWRYTASTVSGRSYITLLGTAAVDEGGDLNNACQVQYSHPTTVDSRPKVIVESAGC